MEKANKEKLEELKKIVKDNHKLYYENDKNHKEYHKLLKEREDLKTVMDYVNSLKNSKYK